MVEELEQDECQDKIDITKDIMMRALRKMSNLKVPGLYNIQGYWLKNLTLLHEKLVVYLQDCLDSRVVPDWLTKDEQCLYKRIKSRGILQTIIKLLHAYP